MDLIKRSSSLTITFTDYETIGGAVYHNFYVRPDTQAKTVDFRDRYSNFRDFRDRLKMHHGKTKLPSFPSKFKLGLTPALCLRRR